MRSLAKTTNVLTVVKVVVPLLTAIIIMSVAFHSVNFHAFGIFREYILKNTQKWKFKREATSNKTNKYILITNIVNHLSYTIPEIVIGKNLVEMFESDGMALLKRYDLRSKLIFESFGIKKFIFLDDLNFFMRTKYILRAYSIIKSCKTMDNFLKFSLNKVNIGQAVYDHYLRFTGMGTTNHFDHKFHLFQ